MKLNCALVMLLFSVPIFVSGQDLENLGLDDISKVSPTIAADTEVKTEGTSSVRITTNWPTTVCLGEMESLDIEDARLVYSAKVKTELEEGGAAFLELWAHVDGGQYFTKGTNDAVSEKTDWKTTETPFIFQKGQKPEKVTLNIVINGKGTVWVDEIVLRKELLQ